MNYITKSDFETRKLGKELTSKLKGGEVVCLYGDLGAGKTVFVQGMTEYFLPGKRTISPTFIIVRHYQISDKRIKIFLHVDLYRLSDIKEVKELEFIEKMHETDTIVAVEWAEKMQNLLPKKRIDVRIKDIQQNKREIIIDYVGY